MLNCKENVLGPGGAGGHGVSNDPPDSGEAFDKANKGHMASGVEDGGEVGDGGAGDGGVEDGGGGTNGGKAGRMKQVYLVYYNYLLLVVVLEVTDGRWREGGGKRGKEGKVL